MYALRTLHCISTVYGESPATEVALHTILAAAELLRAKACAIVSPESTNITRTGLNDFFGRSTGMISIWSLRSTEGISSMDCFCETLSTR